jgi:periodic tryptophan protein 2
MSWSKDSSFILTGSKDMTVRLLNLNKIKDYSPFVFTGHKKSIINCMFSEDHHRIYSISSDGMLFIWKYIPERSDEFKKRLNFMSKIQNVSNLKVDDKDLDMSIDEDSSKLENDKNSEENDCDDNEDKSLYTIYENEISIGRYILEKKQQFTIKGKITKSQINETSRVFTICTDLGIFSIFDLETLENKYTIQITDSEISSLSISNDGLWIAMGSKFSQELLVWEWKSQTYIYKNQGHNYDISSLATSYNSTICVSGGLDGRIKVWDLQNSTCLYTFDDHKQKVTDIKFPYSKANMFVSSSIDGTVRAFDLVKFKNFRIMTTPEPCQLTSVAIDHTSEIVCAGGFDPYSIYIWSLKTGDIVDILTGHTAPISSLVMSTSVDLILSSSWDKSVRAWSVYSKSGNMEEFLHTSEVISLDLSQNNKEFYSTTIKGEIYSWDIESGSLKSKY